MHPQKHMYIILMLSGELLINLKNGYQEEVPIKYAFLEVNHGLLSDVHISINVAYHYLDKL